MHNRFILDGDKSAFHVSYKDGKLLTEDQDEVDEEEEGDEGMDGVEMHFFSQ